MGAAIVVCCIVALEGCKLAWHAQDRRLWAILGHAGLAAVLAALLWLPLAPIAALTVVGSFLALPGKRAGRWWGNGLSAASSWPWEIAGLASLGWTGAWLALPTGWLAGLWWVSGLRPAHWTPSVWRRWFYPAWIVKIVGSEDR